MTATRTRRRPAAALLAACAALRAATAAGQVRRAVAPALQAQPRASSQPPLPIPQSKRHSTSSGRGRQPEDACLRRCCWHRHAAACAALRRLQKKRQRPPRCAPLWSRPPRCARRCMAPRQGVSLGARALARGVLRGRRGGGGAPYSSLAQPTRPWAQEPRRGSSAAIPPRAHCGSPVPPHGGLHARRWDACRCEAPAGSLSRRYFWHGAGSAMRHPRGCGACALRYLASRLTTRATTLYETRARSMAPCRAMPVI